MLYLLKYKHHAKLLLGKPFSYNVGYFTIGATDIKCQME